MAHQYREAWLEAAMGPIRVHFARAGYTVPDNVQVSCGWPSKNALGRRKRRIGECWAAESCENKNFQIFISPSLADPYPEIAGKTASVLGVLVHEVVHAVVGLQAGHKKPFADCAKAVGLVKPWTATTETAELVETMKAWAEELGPYPMGCLIGIDRKTEKGRMLKMECPCGLKIRTTQKWMDQYGPDWPCPCGGRLIAEGFGNE